MNELLEERKRSYRTEEIRTAIQEKLDGQEKNYVLQGNVEKVL